MYEVYKDKTVLVTGHTGFKGAWLSEWLMMQGARVVGYSIEPPSDPSLYDQLTQKQRIHQDIFADVRNLDKLKSVITEVKPDFIFHMAAQTLVGPSYQDPVTNFETNIMGTINVLEALRLADFPCVAILITTDKVYENREWLHAYREEDPLGGYDPYSASKGCDEIVISSYKRSFLDSTLDSKNYKAVASVRAGNVIGGGDWALDRIVPDCMRSLSDRKSIPVRNKTSTRPWQHVLEPLGGYLTLAEKIRTALDNRKIEHAARLCSPFNFGPAIASNKTVKDLVEEIIKYWPGKWEDKSNPDAPHEAGMLNLSSDKAFHLLEWLPRWEFPRTIEKTVVWYKANDESKNKDNYSELMIEFTRRQIEEYMKDA